MVDLSVSAAEYILENLPLDEAVPVITLWKRINKAPKYLRSYLTGNNGNVEEFEDFLSTHSDFFIVENGRVAHWDSEFENGCIRAVEYFEGILADYYEEHNPYYMNLRGHVGQAPEDVCEFINSLYGGNLFIDFLESHPDAFFVLPDGTVTLIEVESVEYFENVIDEYGGGNYINLRGHIGQAPTHIQTFINECYPGYYFLDFLRNNDNVFYLDLETETVYLH